DLPVHRLLRRPPRAAGAETDAHRAGGTRLANPAAPGRPATAGPARPTGRPRLVVESPPLYATLVTTWYALVGNAIRPLHFTPSCVLIGSEPERTTHVNPRTGFAGGAAPGGAADRRG